MDIARLWRQQSSNLRLEGSRCSTCGELIFPERNRCPKCRGVDLEIFRFGGKGELVAFTAVFEAPRGFTGQVPYLTGIVRLDEGPLLTTMVTDIDLDKVRVGMRMEMVTRRIRCDSDDSPILYGYKFAPEYHEQK